MSEQEKYVCFEKKKKKITEQILNVFYLLFIVFSCWKCIRNKWYLICFSVILLITIMKLVYRTGDTENKLSCTWTMSITKVKFLDYSFHFLQFGIRSYVGLLFRTYIYFSGYLWGLTQLKVDTFNMISKV